MTPVEPNIVGVLRGSVQFQWSVNRISDNVHLMDLRLNKGTSYNSVTLFSFDVKQPQKIENITDRLNATIIGDVNTDIEVTYNLVLKNIQFEDENTSYYLCAIFENWFIPKLVPSGATVQLVTVKGLKFSISTFLCLNVIF